MSFSQKYPQFTGINDRIRLLVLQSTPFCNIGCTYCYLSEQSRADKSLMSIDIIKKAVKLVANSGLLHDKLTVLWHAGEPTAISYSYYEKALMVINEELKGRVQLNFDFQTNAVGISDEWCEFIKRNKINIGVSIDGPENIHNSYRLTKSGKGTFNLTMRGIELLKKYDIPFSVISVITDKSLEDPIGLISFLDSLDPTNIGFNIEEIEGANKSSSINIYDKKLTEFVSQIYDWLEKRNKLRKCREISSILRTIGNLHQSNYINRQGENKAFSIITIDKTGNVSTFSPELTGVKDDVYGDFIFGTVDNNIDEIIRNNKFQKTYSDIESGISMCKNSCKYFRYCSGGSPSNKLLENGTFASMDTHQCWFRKKVFTDVVMEKLSSTIVR